MKNPRIPLIICELGTNEISQATREFTWLELAVRQHFSFIIKQYSTYGICAEFRRRVAAGSYRWNEEGNNSAIV